MNSTLYFPVNLESPEQVAHAVGVLHTLRENRAPTEPFDIVVACPGADVAAYADAGARRGGSRTSNQKR
jgi:hypothetical protein